MKRSAEISNVGLSTGKRPRQDSASDPDVSDASNSCRDLPARKDSDVPHGGEDEFGYIESTGSLQWTSSTNGNIRVLVETTSSDGGRSRRAELEVSGPFVLQEVRITNGKAKAQPSNNGYEASQADGFSPAVTTVNAPTTVSASAIVGEHLSVGTELQTTSEFAQSSGMCFSADHPTRLVTPPEASSMAFRSKQDCAILQSTGQSAARPVQSTGSSASHVGSASAESRAELAVPTVPQGYTSLQDLKSRGSTVPCQIAGIVHSVESMTVTKTGSKLGFVYWQITLWDASSKSLNPFSVTCFTKSTENNIPDVKKGEIMVLRGVSASQYENNPTFNGMCAAKPGWSWTRYVPTGPLSASITHGGLGSTTSSELDPEEGQYCVQLSNWWRSNPNPKDSPPQGKRLHKLIKDVTPHMDRQGHFDCTVEIVRGERLTNNPNIYRLWVTDYTANPKAGAPGNQATWASFSLSKGMFRVECWGKAGDLIEQAMSRREYQEGDDLKIQNVKAKADNNGRLEGSFSDDPAKMLRKLDEGHQEQCPELKELLERKRKWKETQNV
ncbi:hypothetical protein EIP91_000298 [Steccherinum ochraceum]|uniref:Protection of telomeres protein 1 ssDNA-binding domain-containing protein n=1 Tax=Steccherinum ochraceum TaxID=92696 RepID=A0A4R0RIH5_9APHY|nr:hypothetical protein EIP91_000298 [Steccherinum ochraceum]